MTPTLDLSQLSTEQQKALGQLLNQQILMTAPRQEPVDANVIPNPNLGKRIPHPCSMYNHQARQVSIAKDAAEEAVLAERGYTREPFWDEPERVTVKGPGFEEEPNEVAELRQTVEQMQEMIQQLQAKKPMNRRSGE